MRGGSRTAPTNDEDCMQMVGHDHVFIEFHIIILRGQPIPTSLNNAAVV